MNQRTNNIATSVDNNRTFFTDLSNPFPTGVDNYPGRDPSFQQVLLGGTGNQFYRDEEGYPGRSQQFNVALQHQFPKDLSVEVAYIGLRGSHLPATLNMNQLGLDHINRAANDTTVCSLDEQRHHPAGAARLHLDTARHVLRGVSAADRAESVPGDGSRGRVVHGKEFSAISC